MSKAGGLMFPGFELLALAFCYPAVEGGDADAELVGNLPIGQGVGVIRGERCGFGLWGSGFGPSADTSTGAGRFEAVFRALNQYVALKLTEGREHGHHHSASGRPCIELLFDADQLDAQSVEALCHFEQVFR